MSKQSQATALFLQGTAQGEDRKSIIAEIQRVIGVKAAYASTLYATAKRKSGAGSTVTTTKAAPATTHTKPSTSNKITNLSDRSTLRLLRKEFQDAIDAVASAHGLTGDLGNIRFSVEGTSFTTKMTVETGGEGDVAERKADKAAENFKRYAALSGLKASDFGKLFNYGGHKDLRIVGYNTRAKKYPISLEDANGRGFKVSGGQIKHALGH